MNYRLLGLFQKNSWTKEPLILKKILRKNSVTKSTQYFTLPWWHSQRTGRMWVCVSTRDPWPSLYIQPLQGWWENSGRCKSQVPWYAGKSWLGKQKHWKYFGKIYHNMYLILFRSESWKTYLYADKSRSNGCLLRDFKVNKSVTSLFT